MEAKFLKNRLRIANESFMLLVTFFRVRKFEKLNFLKRDKDYGARPPT